MGMARGNWGFSNSAEAWMRWWPKRVWHAWSDGSRAANNSFMGRKLGEHWRTSCDVNGGSSTKSRHAWMAVSRPEHHWNMAHPTDLGNCAARRWRAASNESLALQGARGWNGDFEAGSFSPRALGAMAAQDHLMCMGWQFQRRQRLVWSCGQRNFWSSVLLRKMIPEQGTTCSQGQALRNVGCAGGGGPRAADARLVDGTMSWRDGGARKHVAQGMKIPGWPTTLLAEPELEGSTGGGAGSGVSHALLDWLGE